ncbi:glycoside hydrolase family 2 TIM barrel-domain containing protein, partial [Arachidicoccus sp.]|uniref:glycoside hydrolase family 2 TIM barrel-domain containing protein n=1 Tax=Arachidicoccus sp. TaxID=1872624 RepID=UPI003D1BC934
MKYWSRYILILLLLFLFVKRSTAQLPPRQTIDFDNGWYFYNGDDVNASRINYHQDGWQAVTLPHDWSIYGSFSPSNPATNLGGSLPGGIGWYRKSFTLSDAYKEKIISILFDGVYKNSEVWVNGHYLGKRPNGYISFAYQLSKYLVFGNKENIIAVRVDNSEQPNSRWYSGSGINRNVWLIATDKIAVRQWGTFTTTPKITLEKAIVNQKVEIENRSNTSAAAKVVCEIYNDKGALVSTAESPLILTDKGGNLSLNLSINHPQLWSTGHPFLYEIVTKIYQNRKLLDSYKKKFGIRSYRFDAISGFYLNGKPMKILGVCLHSSFGALGTAVNKRAIERELQILKDMGCNAIRTAHNPPSPELLNLCDKMGFLVMDEAFDCWNKKKTRYDYAVDFRKWHRQDLTDQILRDRNHPSVFMWSIGNEIREQFDSSGTRITKELVGIVKSLDNTRPVVAALTEMDPSKNFISQANALDVLGFNYNYEKYPLLPQRFKGKKLIATETTSALETRGVYDHYADSVLFWPSSSKDKYVKKGNSDFTVSAYDKVAAYWGTSHEKAWLAVKHAKYISGLFVWSGFDYLGEPTPYPYPARSSYFGIVDLAGFPKDVYYMYQSEWTDKPVLHLFPNWNGKKGQIINVWAYYSQADEVELFLNGKSLGIRRKMGDSLHVSWPVAFDPGILKAVSRKNGKTVLTSVIKTAGNPINIVLSADRKIIKADGKDLSYVTIQLFDKEGNPVTDKDKLIKCKIFGPGKLVGLDNGYQADLESFKGMQHKTWKGKCVAIIQSEKNAGKIILEVSDDGLSS